jgi:hypothetical protein
MAHYLVRAKPKNNLAELRTQLDEERIQQLSPFGGEMQQCLLNARIDTDGYVTWEENCFCNPPLKQEREVLDKYFTELTTQTLQKGEGWSQIEDLPSLWQK